MWCRFIEPQWLRIQETTIGNLGINAKIVLVSDLHVGPFKRSEFLEGLVKKINAIEGAQFNVFAGDYADWTETKDLAALLDPLKKLNRPTYFVMGNHDIDPAVKTTLISLGLIDIEHQVVDFGSFQLTGVGDQWALDDEIKIPLPSKPTILIAHNPDSSMKLNNNNIKLVLSGHTHCGQVRVPYLYKVIIPTEYELECGLQNAPNTTIGPTPVYISSGVGETSLPLRFLNPSTIDVLHLQP